MLLLLALVIWLMQPEHKATLHVSEGPMMELPLPPRKAVAKPVAAPLPSLYSRRSGKQAKKIVHGVGVEAYLENRRDRVLYDVSERRPEKVRLFVQCMELKKEKATELSRSECGDLLSYTPSRGTERLLGRP
ncbi:hypothetical protein K2X33_11045 [bacterium]|nr:hypothetical protein [bacterium]